MKRATILAMAVLLTAGVARAAWPVDGAGTGRATAGTWGGCVAGSSGPLLPVADTWFSSTSPTGHGADVTLRFETGSTMLVDFALPTIPAGCVMTSASLRVNRTVSTSSAGTAAVRRVTGTWNETTCCPSAPAFASSPAATTPMTNGTTPLIFDATAVVAAWYADVAGSHGLRVTSTGSPGRCGSREGAPANATTLTVSWA